MDATYPQVFHRYEGKKQVPLRRRRGRLLQPTARAALCGALRTTRARGRAASSGDETRNMNATVPRPTTLVPSTLHLP